jgi:hypothetical protein
VIDRIEQEARVIGLRFNAPLSTLPSLMLRLSLELLFLWAGMVVYFAAFAGDRRAARGVDAGCEAREGGTTDCDSAVFVCAAMNSGLSVDAG